MILASIDDEEQWKHIKAAWREKLKAAQQLPSPPQAYPWPAQPCPPCNYCPTCGRPWIGANPYYIPPVPLTCC